MAGKPEGTDTRGRINEGQLTEGMADSVHTTTTSGNVSACLRFAGCGLDFPPLPVCTSTPNNITRVCPKLHNSVIPFPKMDDSGFSDAVHPSPLLSSDETTDSTPPIHSQVTRVSRLDLKGNSVVDITSTPISSIPANLFGRQLVFSTDKVRGTNHTDNPSPTYFTQISPHLNCSHLQELGAKTFLRRQTSLEPSNKAYSYKTCSALEDEESQDQTDEAYISNSRCSDLDGFSQHSGLVESFNHALRHFSPPVPSKLIGRRIGVEKVDLVSELQAYGLDVVSLLLPYLLPVDIVRMCLVSRQWRQLCTQHQVASQVRQLYLASPLVPEDMGKENQVSPSKLRSQKRALTVSSGQLAEIQPVELCGAAKVSMAPTSVVYSSLYDKTRNSLRWEERLRHCPKCHAVSKVLAAEERGQCLSLQCQADFCTRCFAPYHYPAACAPILVKKSKTDSVGSKKSKKNLKRL